MPAPLRRAYCLLALLVLPSVSVRAFRTHDSASRRQRTFGPPPPRAPGGAASSNGTLLGPALRPSKAWADELWARFAGLMARGAAGEPSDYGEFLPRCLDHLRSLVESLDQAYTHAQLGAVLASECSSARAAGFFGSAQFCLEFGRGLAAARGRELDTGSAEGYPPLCKGYFERRSGSPSAAPPPPPAAEKPPAPAPSPARAPVDIGSAKCPCVGFSGLEGELEFPVDGKATSFPAETGGRCHAWDRDSHPLCQGGADEAWCGQKWCYVDPCSCDLPAPPKLSAYMPGVTFQGKHIYYSYATCGGSDSFTEKHSADACVNQRSEADCSSSGKCVWDGGKCLGKELTGDCGAPMDPFVVGFKGCRCIGLAGLSGSINAGDSMHLPAELGSSCEAWDQDHHAKCKGSGSKPPWCSQKWCFVDPCSCHLSDETPPAVSSYLPAAMYQNKPLYYSYATCQAGAEDTFTKKEHPEACINQKGKDACEAKSRCAWSEGRCLGKELLGVC